MEIHLKYGCNPNQKPARIYIENEKLPIEVLNGNPGYINFLDALNGWQLVSEIKEAVGQVAAASFKHVSPAGVAIGKDLTETEKKAFRVDDLDLDFSPIANAYIRARGADRMSSFGDFIALSDTCDESLALVIKREVSDGIIAPDYTKEALEILKGKKNGNYPIIKIDSSYVPQAIEKKQVFGITFEQERNNIKINKDVISDIVTENKSIPEDALSDMVISMIVLKYTQSNSVCFVKDGNAIGIGAGGQSRIHCTRIAADKADNWFLRQNPKVLNLPFIKDLKRAEMDNATDLYIGGEGDILFENDNWKQYFSVKPEALSKDEKTNWLKKQKRVTIGSDAFFPFSDNIERAYKSGVTYITQPGGSVRDAEVIECANRYNMVMAFTGIRLFLH